MAAIETFWRMKSERLYQALKELAEKLGIEVAEQNFRLAGIPVRSGFCKVKGKDLFLIDKHKSLSRKIEILSAFLGQMEIEEVYLVPALRDHLLKFRGVETRKSHEGDQDKGSAGATGHPHQ